MSAATPATAGIRPGIGPAGCLGIDPGPVWTGLTLRARGNRYLAHQIIHRTDDETPIGPGLHYLTAIRDGVSQLLKAWEQAHPAAGAPAIAVEAVKAPCGYDIAAHGRTGRQAPVRPRDVMGLAYVAGAVRMAWPDAIEVPHGGYGSNPLASYPPEMVTPGERAAAARHQLGMLRPAGTSTNQRHARSSWDVAGAGLLLAQGHAYRTTRGTR